MLRAVDMVHLRKFPAGALCGSRAKAVRSTSRPEEADCPRCRRRAGLSPFRAPAPAYAGGSNTGGNFVGA